MQASAGQSSAAHAVRWHVRVFEPDHNDDGVLIWWKLERVVVLMFLQGMRRGVFVLQLKSIDETISTSISLGFEEKMDADVRAAPRPAPPLVCVSDACRLQSSANRPSPPSWFVPAEVLVLKINGVQV